MGGGYLLAGGGHVVDLQAPVLELAGGLEQVGLVGGEHELAAHDGVLLGEVEVVHVRRELEQRRGHDGLVRLGSLQRGAQVAVDAGCYRLVAVGVQLVDGAAHKQGDGRVGGSIGTLAESHELLFVDPYVMDLCLGVADESHCREVHHVRGLLDVGQIHLGRGYLLHIGVLVLRRVDGGVH